MLEITIDSREQSPWSFDSTIVHAVRGTVKTGDYCLTGDRGFSIERKSLNDFLGTISTGWERFQREVYRAKDAGYALPIIVEARFSDILFSVDSDNNIIPPQHDHPRLTPQFILKRIGELAMIGAWVMFADGPTEAAMLAVSILHARYKELHADED